MFKEIIMKDMETDEMRDVIKEMLEDMEEERGKILDHLKENKHENLQIATDTFEIASLLHEVCLKSLYKNNDLCAQITSILVSILNGVNGGNVVDCVEELFKAHSLVEKAVKESPTKKSKMN